MMMAATQKLVKWKHRDFSLFSRELKRLSNMNKERVTLLNSLTNSQGSDEEEGNQKMLSLNQGSVFLFF